MVRSVSSVGLCCVPTLGRARLPSHRLPATSSIATAPINARTSQGLSDPPIDLLTRYRAGARRPGDPRRLRPRSRSSSYSRPFLAARHREQRRSRVQGLADRTPADDLARCGPHAAAQTPAARLAAWRALARKHISADMCARLTRLGFADLAIELLRQRGDLP